MADNLHNHPDDHVETNDRHEGIATAMWTPTVMMPTRDSGDDDPRRLDGDPGSMSTRVSRTVPVRTKGPKTRCSRRDGDPTVPAVPSAP